MDLGETTDLHPHNKKDVAKRISLWVRNQIYGEEICCHGPVLVDYRLEEDILELYFEYDDSQKEELSNYEIKTEQQGWISVKALHQPGTVSICLRDEKNQKIQVTALRYAWYDDPGPLDFYNSMGLPAESFMIELVQPSQ